MCCVHWRLPVAHHHKIFSPIKMYWDMTHQTSDRIDMLSIFKKTKIFLNSFLLVDYFWQRFQPHLTLRLAADWESARTRKQRDAHLVSFLRFEIIAGFMAFMWLELLATITTCFQKTLSFCKWPFALRKNTLVVIISRDLFYSVIHQRF